MTATPVQPQRVEFVRAISRLDATALVVGSMIGSGIFIVSADILRQVHSPGLLLTFGCCRCRDAVRRAVVWGAGGHVPQSGRELRLSARRDLALFGYLYGLDPVRRDSNRHDRRRRRRIRAFHVGAHSQPLPPTSSSARPCTSRSRSVTSRWGYHRNAFSRLHRSPC